MSRKNGIKDLKPNISTPNQFYNTGQLAGYNTITILNWNSISLLWLT